MSTYPQVRFMTSAAEAHQLAPDVGREIAFAGRSNAGKSTAINAITERSGLARVSRTPGRTQLINFFELSAERRLVDLPGYGFAKVPERVRAQWLELMEHYFNSRESLVGLMLIVDSRRGLGEQDVGMLEWVLARGRRAHVLLTKSDKLNRTETRGRSARDAKRHAQTPPCPRSCSPRMRSRGSRRRAPSWMAGCDGRGQRAIFVRGIPGKKRPRWLFSAATEADQPGMGMTNRVLPAQGEERGASLTLTGLDGGALRKFQPFKRICAKRGYRAKPRANCRNPSKIFAKIRLRTRDLPSARDSLQSSVCLVPVRPIPTSTLSGTRSSAAPAINWRTPSTSAVTEASRHFEHEFVMHLHDEARGQA